MLPAVGLVAAVVLGGCASTAGDKPPRAVLAGGGGGPTASSKPSVEIDPGGSSSPTPLEGGPWREAVSSACAEALGGGRYAALAEVAQTADDHGVTSFWARGASWVACDVLLDPAADGPVLVTSPPGDRSFGAESFILTATEVPATGPLGAVRFVAAGRLPQRVDELVYVFPDGHEERARFVASVDGSGDTWWSVAYTASDGVLVSPGAGTDALDPLTVEIVGAAAEAFRVPWEAATASAR
jgi:hypothetical protein